MGSDYRCFFCFTRAFEKLLEKESISTVAKNNFTYEMVNLYANNRDKITNPELARKLHALLRKYTLNPDPFIKEKKENNNQALGMLSKLDKIINRSADPFTTALRLAISGNIIDFAINDKFDLQKTISHALTVELAIDHSVILKEKSGKAKKVLYLGDNAGEIVFDKVFMKIINHPDLTFVVRGAPVINDVTIEDAEYIGMSEVANVISNGYDAPSTVPENSSKTFQKYFREADLIISKGQGNLEGLYALNDDRIFFLLMVKCDVFAEFLEVQKGSCVVYNPALVKNNVTINSLI